MTEGHKHRFVTTTSGSWLERVLTRTIVWRSRDLAKVEASRFVYKPDPDEQGRYLLSLLGLLHALTGLTLYVPDDFDDPKDPL